MSRLKKFEMKKQLIDIISSNQLGKKQLEVLRVCLTIICYSPKKLEELSIKIEIMVLDIMLDEKIKNAKT